MRRVETIRTAAQTGGVEIEDGRVAMQARAPDAALHVRATEHTPLVEAEPVVALKITGEDLQADVELTATGFDALVDALSRVQTDLREAADDE